MKDSNTSLTIRAKVESSKLNNNSSLTPLVVQSSKFGNSTLNTSTAGQQSHNNSNNSDDEFECEGLGIGNLIIDLDADIKSDERLSSENESHYTATKSSINKSTNKSPTASNLSNLFDSNMSTSSKAIRDVNNGNQTIQSNQQANKTSASNQFQSTTSDNSLKLKLKRKSIGGKSSESKLEIVQSTLNATTNNTNSTTEVEKIKHHSSSKNKNSSHKEKKEKKERKDKNSNLSSTNSLSTKNGNIDSLTLLDSKEQQQRSPVVVLNFDKKIHNQTDHPFSQINLLKKEANSLDSPSPESPPFKKSKNEDVKIHHSTSLNGTTIASANKSKPETRSVSTGTNVSTMTEPECLGFCEPGSAICLEGITWAEAEGVLVVNVTWRGKSYVGTLLDCTRHDWGPPRLCDSPTSDLESKGLKGRGKRVRSSISEQDSRLFQSKLRNGKGRRNNFTVPASPLKVDQQNKRNNRNGKDVDKSNSQQSNRNTPTPTTPIESNNSSITSSPASTKQPNSPVLIECPEPNCCKKYRHMNGLKYHQTHAHKGDGLDDTSKEATDNEEMETDCVENSLTNKSTEKDCNDKLPIEHLSDKKLKQNCDKQTNKNSDNDAQSPAAYSDISDVGESSNGNEPNELSTKNSSCSTNHQSQINKSSSEKKEDDSPRVNELNVNSSDQNSRESDATKSETTKLTIKDENHQHNEREDQPSVSPIANNVLDKSGLKMPNNLTNLNSNSHHQPQQQQQMLQHQQQPMNPTTMNQLQFPFNMLPPYSGLPMDQATLHAYFMQQDRFLMDEQQKQLIAQQQQHKSSLSPQLMNSQQPPQSQHHQQQSTSQFNQSTPNQHQSQPLQNKPSSPYDFIQHQEKQQQEMLKLTNRNTDDRFMNKNSLGNRLPSSPKQSQSSSTSVQQLFNQHQNALPSANNSLVKDDHRNENRTTPKQPKPDEGIKATMESHGPPPTPTNSFYSMPFLGPQGLSPFDPFRTQQAVAFNHPNAAFMNNLRFPLGAPQLPMMGGQMAPQSMPGQDMNSKMNSGPLSNANGNNKKAYEMLQQVSQQYNLKEMQDKMLISPNSANKNGLPGQPVGHNNPRQSTNHLGMPTMPGHSHPSIQSDPFSALLKQAASFPK